MRMTDFASGLQYIGIRAADPTETLMFYTDLGFEPFYVDTDPDTGGTVSFMQLGNLMLKIQEREETAAGGGAGVYMSVSVNDIEGAMRYVQSRGLKCPDEEIHTLPFPGGGLRFFTVEGPDGEIVEFCQRLQ